MNDTRRKELADLAKRAGSLVTKEVQAAIDLLSKLAADIDDIKSDLERIREEEQDYYDMMPENFQNSERGENSQSAITEMETAEEEVDTLKEHVDTLSEAASQIADQASMVEAAIDNVTQF